ncbi:MAG: hypothetical protein RLZ98_2952 [Pseudomonadota bacterium]
MAEAGAERRFDGKGMLALTTVGWLVAFADWLYWGRPTGISVAAGLLALAVGVALINPMRTSWRERTVAIIVLALAVAPLVEDVTTVSVFFGLLGIATFALMMSGQLKWRWPSLAGEPLKLLAIGPLRLAPDLVTARGGLAPIVSLDAVSLWVVPLALTAVFLGLFSSANPLIAKWLVQFNPHWLIAAVSIERVLFWLAAASFAWGMITPRAVRMPTEPDSVPIPGPALPPAPETDPVILAIQRMTGPQAILRALVLFNLLFAVQTTLDIEYLWRGAALPDGMSYAEYAHRGAYPLIATAVLAAVFVLATFGPGRRLEKSLLARVLVLAWIAQNVVLVLSSVLRLNLYVEVYSLSHWRIAAFIWMGLVAFGLISIMIRIALRQSNTWLFGANLAATLAVLYACAFFNFSGFIADYNVSHSREVSGKGVNLDYRYLVSLGPEAIPAMDRIVAEATTMQRANWLAVRSRCSLTRSVERQLSDWRGWTWRAARLGDYLAKAPRAAWCQG